MQQIRRRLCHERLPALVVLEGAVLGVSMPAPLAAAAAFVGFAYEGLYLFFSINGEPMLLSMR